MGYRLIYMSNGPKPFKLYRYNGWFFSNSIRNFIGSYKTRQEAENYIDLIASTRLYHIDYDEYGNVDNS